MKRNGFMILLAAVDIKSVNNSIHRHAEYNDFDLLHQELAKGIMSMKSGEVYTLEAAWEEIDKT